MKNIALVFVFIFSMIAPSFGSDIIQSLFGRWTIDSIITEADKSSSNTDTFSSIFSMGKHVAFCTDGTINEVIDTLMIPSQVHAFKYDENLGEILIKDGHTIDRYRVTSVTAERMELVSEEGVVLILKKM
jgi:hypothetical protein